jgi:hypothetical protein
MHGYEQIIDQLIALSERTGANAVDLGAAAGVSHTTIRWALQARKLPRVDRPRDRIERFVRLNADARCRADLRFLP